MKNKNNDWCLLVQIILLIVVIYLFILSLFFNFLVLPVRALIGLLFITMAYTYKETFKDTKLYKIYLIVGILALLYFLVGVIIG